MLINFFRMTIKQNIWFLTLAHLWIKQKNQTKDPFTELNSKGFKAKGFAWFAICYRFI